VKKKTQEHFLLQRKINYTKALLPTKEYMLRKSFSRIKANEKTLLLQLHVTKHICKFAVQ
jgi:hypothetical protein